MSRRRRRSARTASYAALLPERHSMKMAKASEADLKMAMDLTNALESLERYSAFPEALRPDPADPAVFDIDDGEHCREVIEHLLALVRSASLMRVVWGMAVVCAPANKLLDPNADTLEHHPDTDDAKKDAERLNWLVHHLSGKELRRIGIETSGGGPLWGRVAIDAAMLNAAAVGAA